LVLLLSVSHDPKGWAAASKSVRDRIYNTYSSRDSILERLYNPALAFVADPAGLGAIEVEGSELIENWDMRDLVEGHPHYKPKLSLILERIHARAL
jgi:hypothetical protein